MCYPSMQVCIIYIMLAIQVKYMRYSMIICIWYVCHYCNGKNIPANVCCMPVSQALAS